MSMKGQSNEQEPKGGVHTEPKMAKLQTCTGISKDIKLAGVQQGAYLISPQKFSSMPEHLFPAIWLNLTSDPTAG